MKKLRFLFLILLLSFILVACSNSKSIDKSLENNNVENQENANTNNLGSSDDSVYNSNSEALDYSDDESLELLKQGYILKEDAIDEFIYLYELLKESFPHLNSYKRKYEKFGFDPENRYNHYYTLLNEKSEDKLSIQNYYTFVKKYLDEFIGFAHLMIYKPSDVNYDYQFRQTFSYFYDMEPEIAAPMKTLSNEKSQIFYHHLGVTSETMNQNYSYGSDLIFKYFDEYSAAYVNINSFAIDFLEVDKEPLLEFYKSISNYDNLIIDISNNGGGTTEYWRDLIMLPNIDKPVTGTFTPLFFQESERIKAFVDELGFSYYPISEFDVTQYPNFNKDDFEDLAYVIDTSNAVENYFAGIEIPTEKIFKGDIYILTGKSTYSGADQFAFFAKATGFATLVGTSTGGGTGVLGFPFHIALPKSGLTLRFDSLYRIDETGKSIDEFGTPPDVVAIGEGLALQTCLNYIASKR